MAYLIMLRVGLLQPREGLSFRVWHFVLALEWRGLLTFEEGRVETFEPVGLALRGF
jgi:hypothetical protein